jgi:hypothetical protein
MRQFAIDVLNKISETIEDFYDSLLFPFVAIIVLMILVAYVFFAVFSSTYDVVCYDNQSLVYEGRVKGVIGSTMTEVETGDAIHLPENGCLYREVDTK